MHSSHPSTPVDDIRPGHTVNGPVPFRMPDPALETALLGRIGLQFSNPLLFRQALTHRSVLFDWSGETDVPAILQSNERLEFLGDAVLGLVTAEFLFSEYPDAAEGALTRDRAQLVRAETLVQWSQELGLADALYLGTGETITSNPRDRILATAFEALVGAIYQDQGIEAARTFLLRFLERDREAVLSESVSANPKGQLQELVQQQFREQPLYETTDESGPDHARQFQVRVIVHGESLGEGRGRSKREAQQMAAREAVQVLINRAETGDNQSE